MTAVEQQQQIVNLLESALASVSVANSIDQQTTHATHPRRCYSEIEEQLNALLAAERGLLKRIQTIGR